MSIFTRKTSTIIVPVTHTDVTYQAVVNYRGGIVTSVTATASDSERAYVFRGPFAMSRAMEHVQDVAWGAALFHEVFTGSDRPWPTPVYADR